MTPFYRLVTCSIFGFCVFVFFSFSHQVLLSCIGLMEYQYHPVYTGFWCHQVLVWKVDHCLSLNVSFGCTIGAKEVTSESQ